MTSALHSYKGTTYAYRSEFRPVKYLAPLLGHHKGFKRFKTMLIKGMKHPCTKLPESEHRKTLNRLIEGGNHGYDDEPKIAPILVKNLTEEVKN